MTEAIPLATIKNRFSEIVDRVNKQHDRVIVTRNGVPAAIVMSVEDLESLEETLEILSDPETMASIRASESEIAAGKDKKVSEREARKRWIR